MKTAIFLGAGASAAEGAPMQGELFKEFFKSNGANDDSPFGKMYKSLVEFFDSVFGVNPERQDLGSINFPTFEEALGILDLSESRGESLRAFSGRSPLRADNLGDIFSGNNEVRLIRLYLVLAMSTAIEKRLRSLEAYPTYPHQMLVANLKNQKRLSDTIFISTNYDLLMDGAISRHFEQAAVDYGVEFAGPPEYLDQLTEYTGSRVALFKIHGSLNWLYCPTCNNLRVFDSKIVPQLIYDPNSSRTRCDHCGLVMSPMIVPPTYYKNMSNVFLSRIWNKAENALREVEHIIFCGYSFPDADMHIKYLLKRVQTNRADRASLRFTVINNPKLSPEVRPKTKDEKEWEHQRYERFLGQVNYDYDEQHSFEYFAANPSLFYEG